jgi:hypothetical protein
MGRRYACLYWFAFAVEGRTWYWDFANLIVQSADRPTQMTFSRCAIIKLLTPTYCIIQIESQFSSYKIRHRVVDITTFGYSNFASPFQVTLKKEQTGFFNKILMSEPGCTYSL